MRKYFHKEIISLLSGSIPKSPTPSMQLGKEPLQVKEWTRMDHSISKLACINQTELCKHIKVCCIGNTRNLTLHIFVLHPNKVRMCIIIEYLYVM